MLKKRNLIFFSLLILGVFLITGCWLIPSPTYTVTYDGNGSTGGNVPTDSTEYKENDTVTVLGKGDLVNTGYAFTGWNTQADGSGTDQAEGSTFTMGAADVTLYAQWTINTYTLVMSKTGSGTGTTTPTLGNHIYDYGDEITISASPATSSTFNGWSGDATGTSDVTLTMTEDKSVTATFTLKSYTIAASAGANGSISPSGAVGVNHGADQTFTITPATNYHINDVVVDGGSVGTVGTYTFTDVTADHTIVATFAINTYTVTYNGNVNTGGTAPTDSLSPYEYGVTVTVLDNTGSLVKTGYTFDGWNTQADGLGTPQAVASTFTMGASDVTLFAKWTPLYALRDTGPAGGKIFYVKEGGYSDGWMYLEAAPASTEWANKQWGSYETFIGETGTGIGTGQSNTTTIKNWLDSHSETDRAAQLCGALAPPESDYSDWFLPSKDELNKMWVNLKKGIDENNVTYDPVYGFADWHYWSSSEYSADDAWMQYFSNGDQIHYYCKTSSGWVRPVRAF